MTVAAVSHWSYLLIQNPLRYNLSAAYAERI